LCLEKTYDRTRCTQQQPNNIDFNPRNDWGKDGMSGVGGKGIDTLLEAINCQLPWHGYRRCRPKTGSQPRRYRALRRARPV